MNCHWLQELSLISCSLRQFSTNGQLRLARYLIVFLYTIISSVSMIEIRPTALYWLIAETFQLFYLRCLCYVLYVWTTWLLFWTARKRITNHFVTLMFDSNSQSTHASNTVNKLIMHNYFLPLSLSSLFEVSGTAADWMSPEWVHAGVKEDPLEYGRSHEWMTISISSVSQS